MSLISFNAPDHRAQLNAINGNLYKIAENTKKIGYSLDSIREDMHRVADASEVVAGIKTKEEIQIEQTIKRIQDDDSIMSGLFSYEDAPEHVREEADANSEKISKLRQVQERIKNKRANELLKLYEEE